VNVNRHASGYAGRGGWGRNGWNGGWGWGGWGGSGYNYTPNYSYTTPGNSYYYQNYVTPPVTGHPTVMPLSNPAPNRPINIPGLPTAQAAPLVEIQVR
jgi:hypothetical protein